MEGENKYPGINPHLNSALQQKGGDWKSFHAAHIIHIFEALDASLPDSYYAKPETSIQIGVYDTDIMALKPTSQIIADVLVSREGEHDSVVQQKTNNDISTPTLTLPIPQLVAEEEMPTAIVIYEGIRPITRIELLSPANKPRGSHYAAYLVKREETLYTGLRLVEIDYLHERRPIIYGIPSYPDREAGGTPYSIIVSDPRPTPSEGYTAVYGFGVMDTLPIIALPLEGEDTVRVDFGALYNQTYNRRPFLRLVDYTQIPLNIEAYTKQDQQRIQQHMTKINHSV